MDIVGDRKFVEVPGGKTHELPPLLVTSAPHGEGMAEVLDMATRIVETEDMMADVPVGHTNTAERRRMDLALNLVENYQRFMNHWEWGHSILEWIRQCEMTFDTRFELRNLLRPNVWPHAGRCSFVQLLEDKHVEARGINIERAVGTRLSFLEPPPIRFFSNQFLFYLDSTLANTAYQTWSHMSPSPVSSLPPERFTFEVVRMQLD